ncbi:MAG: glycosyltransferase family 2 protein [Rhodospirillales bacterium]|nr:glycosyltransferase family 2 protein [Rhodospirillales bacterium]
MAEFGAQRSRVGQQEDSLQGAKVCVCACTYRRPDGLSAMLDGIARQTFSVMPRPTLHVVIADNECSDRTREICTEFERQSAIPVVYVCEPRRGISFARNACLDNIPEGFEFFASIDDDEVPDPDWLERLLEAQAATGADVVQGRVVAVFDEGTPQWIIEGNFFGRPRRLFNLDFHERQNLQELESAGTGNVLIRATLVLKQSLRFDSDLALTGGEDTKFFKSLRGHGALIIYADHAVVHERYPRTRANFRYMVTERFRMGHVRATVVTKDAEVSARATVRSRLFLQAATHLRLGVRRIAKTLWSKKRQTDRFAVGAFEAAYGLGILTALAGFRYEHYKKNAV